MAADENDPWARGVVLERFEILYAAWGRPEETDFWRDELLLPGR